MSAVSPERRALRPLWMLTTGVVVGAVASTLSPTALPVGFSWALIAVGVASGLAALRWPRTWALWLIAGLAIAGGRGTQARLHRAALERSMTAATDIALRVRATLVEGWTPARWGWRSRVTVDRARHRDRRLVLPRTCRLEVRGSVRGDHLPPPGSSVEALVSVRGKPGSPLLVAASPALLEVVGAPRGLPRVRASLAGAVLDAAGTNARRIRAAELAAALTLGRRDLLGEQRREGWRRSGLAHLLAVSGLHVGLVAGIVWLAAVIAGVRPRTARIAVLIALPAYALLAGASPSATRAALMGVIYFGARLLGRALVPMAAVLLAVVILLIARPDLVSSAGFQLTVLITAALVRWVPVLVEKAPGPRWLSGAVSVPVVAQIAAAPIVAWHFRTVVPGAVASNLLVPVVLAPTLVAALASTIVATVSTTIAAPCLDAVALGERLLWTSGAVGRASELVIPTPPLAALIALTVTGWLALQSGSRARVGTVGWLLVCISTAGWWGLKPHPDSPRVELLQVTDGLSAVVSGRSGSVIVDGGRWPNEAVRMVSDLKPKSPVSVVASHTDEDHLGGLVRLVRVARAESVVVPTWMLSDPNAVPLLRAARQAGTWIIPVARGSTVEFGAGSLDVVWPPAPDPPEVENERSLVAVLRLPEGAALLTSDIGRATELILVRSSSLACEVLIAPHHGSQGSTSSALLAATEPEVALIPAGPGNIHNHPHYEVLQRLEARGIRYRCPARNGRCGARYASGQWVAFP